ncbi:MAG: hypothetical protein M1503_04295 [Thaumarchaeota archaeon]|nr:hypothetical protein [Nitrososphaerota archaeon]MCL5317471.1 hypothetical protein [Nitrososphaerota archaeon]
MALGYLVGRSVAEKTNLQVSGAALFFLSILPDFDLFFSSFGLEHGTITHSLTFWFAPILFAAVMFGVKKTLIYSSALLSHFLIGDIVLVPTSILWGVSSVVPTLGFGVSTLKHALLESSLFALFLLYLRMNPVERASLFRSKLTSALPFGSALFLTVFMTFIYDASDPELNPVLFHSIPNLILLIANAGFLLLLIQSIPTAYTSRSSEPSHPKRNSFKYQ